MMAKGATVAGLLALAACGKNSDPGPTPSEQLKQRETIWDLFNQKDDGTKVAVNRYLWNASLDVLNFLPVESIDPFTGVISFGYGTPPGGGRAYRATVYISDPALEARSLNVSIQTSGGRPVAAGTQRAVEDAILTRARQLRTGDRKF
ncbi:protein of unknown function [Pseudooceanicola antarcticus]|nr:protein of unknown function [Pseudooceanicola antarcticus]